VHKSAFRIEQIFIQICKKKTQYQKLLYPDFVRQPKLVGKRTT